MTERVVIIGSGQAGVQTAFSLRDEGFEGDVTIVGEEPNLPYQRPPLSKSYLLGKLDEQGVLLKAPQLYDQYRLTLLADRRAEALDRERRTVRLRDGAFIDYDHLVLATGSRPKTIDVPGASLDGVAALRTIADSRRLAGRLKTAKRAVVVGGGFIGLEFAAVARALGVEVTVIELAPTLMARALSADSAKFFEQRHRQWGVRFHFGASITAILGEGEVAAVELSDGVQLPADLVVVGVGVIPNTELGEAAGLSVDDGLVVDSMLRTTDERISAVGDCASYPSPFDPGQQLRLESVQNATDHARCAAARIAGHGAPYGAVPWFWSDQQNLKLQIAGVPGASDLAVLRGSPDEGAFSVFCFKEGRLAAVESVNRGADHIMARRLIAAGVQITPEEAADASVPLKAHLAA